MSSKPQVTKGQAVAALKHLQKAYGAQLTNRPGYNAYVLAMAMAPGTQAQINALANRIGGMSIQGLQVAAPISARNPNFHFANRGARQYHQAHPWVMGVPFTTLRPACVQHGQQATKCTNVCTYGLYVGGVGKFVHNILTGPFVKLASSILSADSSRLGEAVAEATQAGVDYIHVDIMDGRFVPNITFGADMVKALRSQTTLPLDVHLMIAEPERHIQQFAAAGGDIITVHAEACTHLHRVVHQIKESGARAGVAVNPGTPISAVEDLLPDLDLVLVMSVNPGFPAQEFIPGSVDKLQRMRQRLDDMGAGAELEVDGGVNETTAASVARAGARVLVAGSALFNDRGTVRENLDRLRSALSSA